MRYSFDELLEVAEGMCKANSSFMHRWHRDALAVWLRYKCKCACCDRDLLQDRAITYFFSDCDHILPESKYPALEHALSNLVVACAACKAIKSDWDCNSEEPLVTHELERLTDDQHAKLVARCRHYVEAKKAESEREFEQEKALIQGFFKSQYAQLVGE